MYLYHTHLTNMQDLPDQDFPYFRNHYEKLSAVWNKAKPPLQRIRQVHNHWIS
jgi:hypothetical protein